MTKVKKETRTRLGQDLEAAFRELAAYLRGEAEAQSYDASDDLITPSRICANRG